MGLYVALILVAVAVVVSGPVLIFVGVRGFVSNQAFLSSAVSTQGTVIDRVKQAEYLESGNADHWYPVVRFTARTGQVVEFSPPSGSDPPQWPVGRVVGVLYDPDNPQHARIDTAPTRWGWSVLVNAMLVALGLGLCCIAFLGVRSWRRNVRR
jgi:hypothetical protein